jgi:hypothetical protein
MNFLQNWCKVGRVRVNSSTPVEKVLNGLSTIVFGEYMKRFKPLRQNIISNKTQPCAQADPVPLRSTGRLSSALDITNTLLGL